MSEIVKINPSEYPVSDVLRFSNEDLYSDMIDFIAKYSKENTKSDADFFWTILRTIDKEIVNQEQKTGYDVGYSFCLSANNDKVFLGVRPISYSLYTPRGERYQCIIIGEACFKDIPNFASEFSEWFGDIVKDHFSDDDQDGEATDFYKEFGISPYSFA
jgi:hypothetical protein